MFNRNTRAIQDIRTTLDQQDKLIQELIRGLAVSYKSQRSILTRVVRNEADFLNSFSGMREQMDYLRTKVTRHGDHLIYLSEEPPFTIHAPRPLTGIRRELCPTD